MGVQQHWQLFGARLGAETRFRRQKRAELKLSKCYRAVFTMGNTKEPPTAKGHRCGSYFLIAPQQEEGLLLCSCKLIASCC